MKSQKEIIIEIDKTGAVTIDACGFSGPDCVKATEALEKALGTVAVTRKKPEYTKAPEQKMKQTI